MESIATREAFGKALLELGHENNDVVVVGGDLNVSTFAHQFGHGDEVTRVPIRVG